MGRRVDPEKPPSDALDRIWSDRWMRRLARLGQSPARAEQIIEGLQRQREAWRSKQ